MSASLSSLLASFIYSSVHPSCSVQICVVCVQIFVYYDPQVYLWSGK